MEIKFDNKVAVITGSGGGIGYAMAKAFAENGAKVAVCDIKGADEAAQNLKNLGFTAKGFYLDVTDRECVKIVFSGIKQEFGGIDIMINNAGINVGTDERKTVENFSDKWWDAINNVDLTGCFNCTKAAVPLMGGRKGCNIINISSVTGMVPLRNQCAFTAAKAGVINFSKSAAIELATKNIRVNVISPGSINLDKTKVLFAAGNAMEGLLSHIPQHRQGSTEDIANSALFLASDFAGYITGVVLNIDGGWICGYNRDF